MFLSGVGGSSGEGGGQKCECSSRQCEWFAFNTEVVMPEYVIDFEYITRVGFNRLN